MEYWQSVVIGIVEGLTEFLPVSSTGHMALADKILGLEGDFLPKFQTMIQLGAILAVVVLYWTKFSKNVEAWKRIAVAFFPTAIIGYIGKKLFEDLQSNYWVIVAALIGVGILFLFVDKLTHGLEKYHEISEVPLATAGLIGLLQTVSIVPGVSRSGASIISGLFLGLSKITAAEFSFLLAIPTMLGATALTFLKGEANFSGNQWGLLSVGFLVSFLVALASIRFMMRLLPKYGFAPFGAYRIVAGLVFALFFLR